MRKNFYAVILLFAFAFMVSCASNQTESNPGSSDISQNTISTSTPTPTPEPYPQEVLIVNGDVSFRKIIDDYYYVGTERLKSVELKYNYQPKDVNIAVEEWSSSDESVATVSNNGTLIPVNNGSCIISLHVSDGLTDGVTTSINISVEDGITKLTEESFPSYDSIFDYAENTLKFDADSYNYDSDENYNDTDDGFYYMKGDVSVLCSNKDSKFFYELDLKEWVVNMGTEGSYVGQMEGLTMLVNNFTIDYFCDEYHCRIFYDINDPSLAMQIVDALGLPNPTNYFDLEALK